MFGVCQTRLYNGTIWNILDAIWWEPRDYTVCKAAAQPSPQDFRANLV